MGSNGLVAGSLRDEGYAVTVADGSIIAATAGGRFYCVADYGHGLEVSVGAQDEPCSCFVHSIARGCSPAAAVREILAHNSRMSQQR